MVKKPFRYRSAAETATPGYLKRRFEAYRRLQRMQKRAANVAPITTGKKRVA